MCVDDVGVSVDMCVGSNPARRVNELSAQGTLLIPRAVTVPEMTEFLQNYTVYEKEKHIKKGVSANTIISSTSSLSSSSLSLIPDQSLLDLHSFVQKLWTRNEDEKLKSLVVTYGRRWTIIAEAMQRSPEDVMLRYDFKIVARTVGQWTREEDAVLSKLVEQFGPKWSKVGELIGRSGQQCSLRYRCTLDPRLKWRLWTTEEDDQLVSLREEAGYNWAMISAVLDRAGTSCRYRYLKLKKEVERTRLEREKHATGMEGEGSGVGTGVYSVNIVNNVNNVNSGSSSSSGSGNGSDEGKESNRARRHPSVADFNHDLSPYTATKASKAKKEDGKRSPIEQGQGQRQGQFPRGIDRQMDYYLVK